MDMMIIKGGVPLKGEVTISGAKNAALPLMAASLLTEDKLVLHHVPHLSDITTMAHLLMHHGADLTVHHTPPEAGRQITMQVSQIDQSTAPYGIVRKMRASVLVLGPLLARVGQARVSLPGGCAIGTRPVNQHLAAMEALGATVAIKEGYIEAVAPEGGLRGAEIVFDSPSVGATENALMAAVLAQGRTVMRGVAQEPEVVDLAACLSAMGAQIEGAGSDCLEVEGVEALHGAEHTVIPDRIEAGTYAVAAAITGGTVTLKQADPMHLYAIFEALEQAGVAVEVTEQGIMIQAGDALKPLEIATGPYPLFPTDMQAQLTALLCHAEGDSTLCETIFENRFMHVPELVRMGANITQEGECVTIQGPVALHGAEVMATDLRASVALVLAALAAEGTTHLHRVYHIDRGYERIEEKLRALGADIVRKREA